jgi:hypothetical protein
VQLYNLPGTSKTERITRIIAFMLLLLGWWLIA